MFQRGDAVLHTACGGCKSRLLHQFSWRANIVEELWLRREDVNDIADELKIESVPSFGEGTLHEMVEICRKGFASTWGEFEAEGLIARPRTELLDRLGERVITKLKCKDFR